MSLELFLTFIFFSIVAFCLLWLMPYVYLSDDTASDFRIKLIFEFAFIIVFIVVMYRFGNMINEEFLNLALAFEKMYKELAERGAY